MGGCPWLDQFLWCLIHAQLFTLAGVLLPVLSEHQRRRGAPKALSKSMTSHASAIGYCHFYTLYNCQNGTRSHLPGSFLAAIS